MSPYRPDKLFSLLVSLTSVILKFSQLMTSTQSQSVEISEKCSSVLKLNHGVRPTPEVRCTLVPGLSPVSCGGLMWVLWCNALCSTRSLTYRKWRRHLSQPNTCFFWKHRETWMYKSVPGIRCRVRHRPALHTIQHFHIKISTLLILLLCSTLRQ